VLGLHEIAPKTPGEKLNQSETEAYFRKTVLRWYNKGFVGLIDSMYDEAPIKLKNITNVSFSK
jgi:hypothetical protein